jgi:hypothetical protein
LKTSSFCSFLDYFPVEGEAEFRVRTVSMPQQFAEKVHAYTLGREGNSRVKDLVDMLILVRSDLDSLKVGHSIEVVFAARATHPAPASLKAPPESWTGPFGALAKSCGIDQTMESAFRIVSAFYSNASEGYSLKNQDMSK